MITTADAPGWLRRSDQAVRLARTMLRRDRAVVIDCEKQICRAALLATTIIKASGIACRQDRSADGKPHDSGILSLGRTVKPRGGIAFDAGFLHCI